MTGLGGGGYVLVRMADGKTAFYDFRERAPLSASRNMFIRDGKLTQDSVLGWKAAAVPGTVKGYEAVHKDFATRPWAELLQPAIDLAIKGYRLSYLRAEAFKNTPALLDFPETKRTFLNGGKFYEPGDLLVQAELGQTLKRIARDGAKDFYQGETARRLAEEMAKHGGYIALADLEGYKVAKREPLRGGYKGYDIWTAPPGSSGGVGLLQMLGMLEGSGYEKSGAGSAAAIHYMAECARRYYADRSEYLGDPAFVTVPVAKLLDPAYIAERRASIDPNHATPSDQVRPGHFSVREGSNTTHFGVVDAQGNAVAITVTLNSQFGAKVTVPGLGFLLNDNMDNFAAQPGKTNQYGLVQGEANAIQPGKQPVSSMTPTIITKNDKLFMVVGTPGGPTIINSVLQAIVNVIDFGMNAQDAVNAPRFHHQWYPDRLFLEPGFSPDTIALLKARGHTIEMRASNNDLNMILLDGKFIQGAVDPRREGKAEGY
jgi:gamma-glutamyltranspeptidase/glutathione hydrolase